MVKPSPQLIAVAVFHIVESVFRIMALSSILPCGQKRECLKIRRMAWRLYYMP